MKKAIIVGATSGIGKELAFLLAGDGYEVGLTGRRTQLLRAIQSELPEKVTVKYMDITDTDTSMRAMGELLQEMGEVELIILCAGTGYINEVLEWGPEWETIQTNVAGITALLTVAFRYFEERKRGHLCAVSSIAALRGGRQSPAYNASKAYLSSYLEGLSCKASRISRDIMVTDIRPGLVDTAMAKGEGLFWVMPVKKAARDIYSGIKKRRRLIYVTKRWRVIAVAIRHMPWGLYRRL